MPEITSTPDGPGIFLRDIRDLAPEVAARHLTWVAVPVLIGGRRTNRDVEWYDRFRDLGGQVVCWSWFDDPEGPPARLLEAFQFAARVGAVSFLLNAEKAWRGRPARARAYVAHARDHADRRRMSLGLVSYSIPRTIRNFPWSEFAEGVDYGMPEIYDRRGAYDPRYPGRAIKGWERAGFGPIVPACAIYVRRERGGWRWRTPAEIARHLALFPPLRSVCAWTIRSRSGVPESALRALARGLDRRSDPSCGDLREPMIALDPEVSKPLREGG